MNPLYTCQTLKMELTPIILTFHLHEYDVNTFSQSYSDKERYWFTSKDFNCRHVYYNSKTWQRLAK